MKTIVRIAFVLSLGLISCGDGGNSGNPPHDSPGLYDDTNTDSTNNTNRDSSYYPR